jgi:hypothetical protein
VRQRCSHQVELLESHRTNETHKKVDGKEKMGHLPLRQNACEKGPFFVTTFSRPFKDQSGAWRNGTSFGLNDLEALLTVAYEAKEWIAAHVLKR